MKWSTLCFIRQRWKQNPVSINFLPNLHCGQCSHLWLFLLFSCYILNYYFKTKDSAGHFFVLFNRLVSLNIPGITLLRLSPYALYANEITYLDETTSSSFCLINSSPYSNFKIFRVHLQLNHFQFWSHVLCCSFRGKPDLRFVQIGPNITIFLNDTTHILYSKKQTIIWLYCKMSHHSSILEARKKIWKTKLYRVETYQLQACKIYRWYFCIEHVIGKFSHTKVGIFMEQNILVFTSNLTGNGITFLDIIGNQVISSWIWKLEKRAFQL